MKSLLPALFFLIAAPFSMVHAQSGALPADYAATIDTWITRDIARTKPRSAPYARIEKEVRIYTGDIERDGDEDCIANYSVAYDEKKVIEYVTVFINKGGKMSKGYKKTVAGPGVETIDSIFVRDGLIHCTMAVWKISDPLCCPSEKGWGGFFYRRGKIKRV